jgi:plastocyanin
MKSDLTGGVVGFDPVGLFLRPGQTVRWICDANVHTTTAYSPQNDNHSLRIPENAKPWASDFLLPGQTFEVTFTVAGVYDYFCAPHEMAGMVGRLVVGRATGPGSLPFEAQGRRWKPVPLAAQKVFPAIADIMQRKILHSSLNFSS